MERPDAWSRKAADSSSLRLQPDRPFRTENMIRHMVLFAFKPSVDEELRCKLLAMLADLPRQFPEMRGFQLGVNVSKRDNRCSHGMTMSFNTLSDLENYLNSERHENLVRENFAPIIKERVIVSMVD
jgi:Stress responsive A/B Barrel Domain